MVYNNLVAQRIPERLGTLKAGKWTMDIHAMLKRIPSLNFYSDSPLEMYLYFDSIEEKLAEYESLQEISTLLELALWKYKCSEQRGPNNENCCDVKLKSRINCGASIVIPHVLSFLVSDELTLQRKVDSRWGLN